MKIDSRDAATITAAIILVVIVATPFGGIFYAWLVADQDWTDFKVACEQVQHGKAVRQRSTEKHVCMMPQPRGRVDSGQAEVP